MKKIRKELREAVDEVFNKVNEKNTKYNTTDIIVTFADELVKISNILKLK